jgi:hypothetical protein
MTPTNDGYARTNGASIIALLAGVWFFISPWVYAAGGAPSAWNNWIAGALIVLFAGMRLSYPDSMAASIVNMLLGIWAFASPWIYGYVGNQARFINSLCVGVIVFVAAVTASRTVSHHGTPSHQAM